jgi:hypothetical protein
VSVVGLVSLCSSIATTTAVEVGGEATAKRERRTKKGEGRAPLDDLALDDRPRGAGRESPVTDTGAWRVLPWWPSLDHGSDLDQGGVMGLGLTPRRQGCQTGRQAVVLGAF